MIIFFQSKSFMRRRVRRYRLRHKIHAIKTRPNNPLRFLQHKNSTSLFGKRFNLCRSQNDVQNTKAFSQQTIRKNNPRNHSIKSTQRQTQQAITTKCNVFEYYNIANSNGFRANRKYAFHKNSTQIHKTKQHNLYFEVTILQTRKSKTLYFLIIGNSQENIFNLE